MSLIVGIMGMLIGSKGSSVSIILIVLLSSPLIVPQNQETILYVRCFVELALASNAPTPLKTQVNT